MDKTKKDIGKLAELDLKKGDLLTIVKRAENDGGWAMPAVGEYVYVQKDHNGNLCFYGISSRYWHEVKSEFKVRRLVNDEPVKADEGTLAGLGLKAGDTVEYVSGASGGPYAYKGCVWTVYDTHPQGYCKEPVAYYKRKSGTGYMRLSDNKWTFRVIKRKADEQSVLWKDLSESEQGALLLAYHNGKSIECRGSRPEDSKWGVTKHPQWLPNLMYRVKPEDVLEWSSWMISSKDGTTKVDLSRFKEVQKHPLPDSKQFVYRTKGKLK